MKEINTLGFILFFFIVLLVGESPLVEGMEGNKVLEDNHVLSDIYVPPNMKLIKRITHDNGQIDFEFESSDYIFVHLTNLDREMFYRGWSMINASEINSFCTALFRKTHRIKDLESFWDYPVARFESVKNGETTTVRWIHYVTPPHERSPIIAEPIINCYPLYIEEIEFVYGVKIEEPDKLCFFNDMDGYGLGIGIVENLPIVPHKLYAFMYVPAEFRSTQLDFRVKKSWLEERDFGPQNILLLKYQNGEWFEQPTKLTGEVGDNIVFSIKMKDFSLFAIVAKRLWYTQPLNLAMIAVAVLIAIGAIYWFRFRR
jgi:hypothetical protein